MSQLKKDVIIKHLDYLTDEQLEFVADIVVLFDLEYVNKSTLMQLAKVPLTSGKVDTAYPIEYYRRIEQVYPNVNKGNLIYDYRTNSYGELVNINDLIVQRILNIMK